MVMNPHALSTLERKLAAGEGQPLRPFPSYERLGKFVTTSIPDTRACVGDFSPWIDPLLARARSAVSA